MLNIGMIGLDTSHATAFAELLHDDAHPYHVPGGRVTVAYPGGSPDFELSTSRVAGFTETLAGRYGVRIVDSPEAVAEACDAILLESADGRVHLRQLESIARYRKPVFVDKPFAVSSSDAERMRRLSERYGFPLMSCSALRYAEGLTRALAESGPDGIGDVIGADCFGPMALQPTQPGLFWYGIHAAEMLYAAMGPGCVRVTAHTSPEHEAVTGEWRDGRIGAIRGNRSGNNRFGALIHGAKETRYVDVYAFDKPYYASLLERVMDMFRGGPPPIAIGETVEIVRFLEAANESRETGKPVEMAWGGSASGARLAGQDNEDQQRGGMDDE